MWFALPLVFMLGVLNRIADMIADDGLHINRYADYSVGILYGLLLAYVITQYPVLAPIGLAVILSCLFTGKIDHRIHYFGLAAFFFSLVLLGFPIINWTMFAIFSVGGVIDEIGNSYVDKRNVKGIIGKFFKLRLTLEVITFAVSLVTGIWILFLAMVSYDLGFTYIFPPKIRTKLINMSG